MSLWISWATPRCSATALILPPRRSSSVLGIALSVDLDTMMPSLLTDKTTSGPWLPGWTQTPARGIMSEVSRFRSRQYPSQQTKGHLLSDFECLTTGLRRTLSNTARPNNALLKVWRMGNASNGVTRTRKLPILRHGVDRTAPSPPALVNTCQRPFGIYTSISTVV